MPAHCALGRTRALKQTRPSGRAGVRVTLRDMVGDSPMVAGRLWSGLRGGVCVRGEGLLGNPTSGLHQNPASSSAGSDAQDFLASVMRGSHGRLRLRVCPWGEIWNDASMELCVQFPMIRNPQELRAAHWAFCCSSTVSSSTSQVSLRQHTPGTQAWGLRRSVLPPGLSVRLVAGS